MNNPFDLQQNDAYQRWREIKISAYPQRLEDLIVEINDPRRLSTAEHHAMQQRLAKTNMVIYASHTASDPDRKIVHLMAQQFGLKKMDHNWLADDDGLTSLTVASQGTRQEYIPYSNRGIQWHTDGYYNSAAQQIQGLLLHCVQSAHEGGENKLLDHEMAYLLLREQDPDFIHALMDSNVMTIPAREDEYGVARGTQTGPVFSITPEGNLHMRYTIRARNIEWKQDEASQRALSALSSLLNSNSPFIFRGKLEPGMGLVSNNVLHDRSAFNDDENRRRLLYRARYMDRCEGTHIHQILRDEWWGL